MGDYTHWNILIISYEICISFLTDEYCSVVYPRADKIIFIIFILFPFIYLQENLTNLSELLVQPDHFDPGDVGTMFEEVLVF